MVRRRSTSRRSVARRVVVSVTALMAALVAVPPAASAADSSPCGAATRHPRFGAVQYCPLWMPARGAIPVHALDGGVVREVGRLVRAGSVNWFVCQTSAPGGRAIRFRDPGVPVHERVVGAHPLGHRGVGLGQRGVLPGRRERRARRAPADVQHAGVGARRRRGRARDEVLEAGRAVVRPQAAPRAADPREDLDLGHRVGRELLRARRQGREVPQPRHDATAARREPPRASDRRRGRDRAAGINTDKPTSCTARWCRG